MQIWSSLASCIKATVIEKQYIGVHVEQHVRHGTLQMLYTQMTTAKTRLCRHYTVSALIYAQGATIATRVHILDKNTEPSRDNATAVSLSNVRY
jgi:hypothetical protein